jgi:hypothetical protein
MYQFPAGDGRQKQTAIIWTHSIREKLVINPLLFPAFAIRSTLRQVDVGEFGPDAALQVNVDFTTYTQM